MPQNISDPMQREAVRRMQELHSRAAKKPPERHRENNDGERGAADDGKSTENTAENRQGVEEAPALEVQRREGHTDAAGLPSELKGLLADRDQSLVLILLILLMGEQSDTSLLMALVYLIL